VEQFELLLRQFGGPGEVCRYRVVKQRLEVYDLEVGSGCYVLVGQQQEVYPQKQHNQEEEQEHQQQQEEKEHLDAGDPLLQLLSRLGQAAAPEEPAPCNVHGNSHGSAGNGCASSSALHLNSSSNGTGSNSNIDSSSSNGCASQQALQQPPRVAALSALTQQQRVVLGLGDAAHALTLTANGGALRLASSVGVVLEAVPHRAVWLTGM
jgi:hypothetical protein